MDELTFTGRASLLSSETAYRLDGAHLAWRSGKGEGRLPLSQVSAIRIFGSPKVTLPLMGGAVLTPGFRQCVVIPREGRPLRLVSAHYLGLGSFKDRRATFDPFVQALEARAVAANPAVKVVRGPTAWVLGAWMLALVTSLLCGAFGLAVAWEGVSLGAGEHGSEIFGGLALAAVCAFNVRSAWRFLYSARGESIAPQAPA